MRHRLTVLPLLTLALGMPLAAQAKHVRHGKAPAALPPPPPPRPTQVVLRDPIQNKNDAAAKIAQKLHLEPGADVLPTVGLTPEEAAANRDKYLLLATQAVEGGYDAVNIYDRGILSWGLMQWSAHQNSLQEVLWYIKGRLLDKNKGRVWADLFKAQGLDVQEGPDGEPAFFVGGPASWHPVVGIDDLRVLFRGTRVVGNYDAPTVTRWSKVFARAGRTPVVQTLQVEWATRRVRDCLNERVDGDLRVRDFSRGDLFSDALTFALWTNNPAACREHFHRAVRACRLVTGEADPAKWPENLFPLLWEQVAGNSTFGTWSKRTASVERMVPVGQAGRQQAYQQLASRGWQLDALRRGAGRGQTWRVPPPAPPKPKLPVRPTVPPSLAAPPLSPPRPGQLSFRFSPGRPGV